MIYTWWSQPEWWSALGTLALVVITGLAVIYGRKAATIALGALRLESAPVLVFAHSKEPPYRRLQQLTYKPQPFAIDTTNWYIVSRDKDGAVTFHRDINGVLDTMAIEPPGTYLEIKNLGRSPAIGITIPLFIYTGERTLDQLASEGPNASFTIDGIGPNGSYFIGIANHLNERVMIQPNTKATQAVWSDVEVTIAQQWRKKDLTVLSQTFSFPSHRR